MADQRPQQHGDDAAKKQIVGQQEKDLGPASAKGHADALDDPGCSQQHERRAMVPADVDPVLGRGQQEAAKHRPAKAEEHFVGVPLNRSEAACRCFNGATEHQPPGDRQDNPGQAGQGEEGPKADQPERVC